jgi:ribonuclease HII
MIGIDEVGRGAWAGPLLVVAARQREKLPSALADSKVISRSRREALKLSVEATCDLGEGWVEPSEIDGLGLTNAMKLGVRRALIAIQATSTEAIIMDGHINYCPASYTNVEAVIDADATHPIVSAASIYAKVTRDVYMTELGRKFPEHGFESHVGYGTNMHKQAIREHGVTPIHRRSYKPIKLFLYSDQTKP